LAKVQQDDSGQGQFNLPTPQKYTKETQQKKQKTYIEERFRPGL
jgi:hypothetical protein